MPPTGFKSVFLVATRLLQMLLLGLLGLRRLVGHLNPENRIVKNVKEGKEVNESALPNSFPYLLLSLILSIINH